MILRSIHVEGWRCFVNPLQVGPFTDGLNVIYAPNRTGKSTLFEALVRGLLDSHRVGGREVEALRPWGRSLAPTVTVEFSHGGTVYRFKKRFLDRTASELYRLESGQFVRLSEGDAADTQVRQILTRNPPGRGLARPENWGLAQILWAPQGNLVFTKLSGDLVVDIQRVLGAQVSGPGTGLLEARIEQAYLQTYTPGGKPRTGKDASAMVRLREGLTQAEQEQREAVSQQQAFEEAASNVEGLRAQRAQAKRNAEAFAKALTEARAQAETYRILLSEKRIQEARAASAAAQYSALKQQTENIKTTRRELKEAHETLRGLQEGQPLRVREVEEREREAAKAKAVLEDARTDRQKVEKARKEVELAQHYLRAKEEAARLKERLKQVRQVEKRLVERKEQRSQVFAPDARALKAIQKAIRDRDQAAIRLDAALITLELVPEKKGSIEVIAGEEPGKHELTAGRPTEVKGSPEVVVDLRGVARLRARGPTGSVEAIRNERDRAAHRLNELAQGFGTMDLEVLEALHEKANELEKRVAEAETQLQTLLSGDTAETIEQEFKKLSTVLEEIDGSCPEWRKTPPDVENLSATADQIRRSFVEAVESAEAAWEAAQTALTAAVEQRAGMGARLEETRHLVETLESKVSDLTSDSKTDQERQAELNKLALAWDAAKASLDEAERRLKVFGEEPKETVARLERQLEAIEEDVTKTLEKERMEQGRLASLAAKGPYSALVHVAEKVARLKEELAREELGAAAVRLLHDTVAQCRAEALAAITGPVEAIATRTLQRIGGGYVGRVRLDEGFGPLYAPSELAGTSVSLDNVSGGEREQIYLATRLALAEIFAVDERQLVVLDDALIATDAGRMARVMSILEEAAQRLQILILTCHPERYRGLEDAQFFDLEAILQDSRAA